MRRPMYAAVTMFATAALVLASGPLVARAAPGAAPSTGFAASRGQAVPEARAYASLVYDPINKDMLLIGGQDASLGLVPSVWSFAPGSRTWHFVGDMPSGLEPTDGAAFDVAAGKVIVHASWLFYSTFAYVSETWAFDPLTGIWENRHPVQSPPAGLCGCGSQMVYDDRAEKVVMFGGLDVPAYFAGQPLSSVETNDTWVYDYASNRWSKMPRPADASRLPSPRNSIGLTYDSRADRIITFGGGDVFGPAPDTWAYDYATNTWTDLRPASSPPARAYGYLAYDKSAGRTIAFGGVTYDFNTETLLQPAETWSYDFRANDWELVGGDRNPSARAWEAMAYSPTANAVVMFGGGPDRQHPTSETWLYRTNADRWSQAT